MAAATAVGLAVTGIAVGANGSAQAAEFQRLQIRAAEGVGARSAIVHYLAPPEGASECLPLMGPDETRERNIPYTDTEHNVVAGDSISVDTFRDTACQEPGQTYGPYTAPQTDLDNWWLTIE